MKSRFLSEKFLTKKGSSSILMIILFSAILLFVVMPVFAITFEKTLVTLMYQDIEENLSLNSFKLFQKIEVNALGKGEINLPGDTTDYLSQWLDDLYDHPQLEKIKIIEIKQNNNELSIKVNIVLLPSLYRSIYEIDHGHDFIYKIEMPMDRKES